MADSGWQGLGLPPFGGLRSEAGEPGLLALLDGLPCGGALIDSQGRLRRTNLALRGLIGPSLPLREGLPVAALVEPGMREVVWQWLGGEGAAPLEVALAVPEGQVPVLALFRLAPLPEGLRALLVEDLSERTRRREEAEAGERLRAVGQLAGGIAHDINNLLSIILGAMDQAGAVAPEAMAELQPARDAASRGAALVRRLLAFARRQQLEPRVIDLDEAVAGTAAMLRSLLGPSTALELRPGALGRRVRVDPVQLDQVLLNLATNARDAIAGAGAGAGAGEGRLTIATDTAVALREEPGVPDALPPGRWAVLEVTDTGPGIPAEMLPRIFEPFFTTRAAQGGTGLGLATVHGIVRQLGGALQIESRPGMTRFRIHLPRHEGEAEEAASAPPSAPGKGVGRHVLLVDDEAPLQRLAAVALERAGHRVTQAEDGDSALELIEAGLEPGAMVSDIAMPGLDGVALARAARRHRPGLPVVLMSGYAEAALGLSMERDGIVFLPKPYRPAELVEVVSALP